MVVFTRPKIARSSHRVGKELMVSIGTCGSHVPVRHCGGLAAAKRVHRKALPGYCETSCVVTGWPPRSLTHWLAAACQAGLPRSFAGLLWPVRDLVQPPRSLARRCPSLCPLDCPWSLAAAEPPPTAASCVSCCTHTQSKRSAWNSSRCSTWRGVTRDCTDGVAVLQHSPCWLGRWSRRPLCCSGEGPREDPHTITPWTVCFCWVQSLCNMEAFRMKVA